MLNCNKLYRLTDQELVREFRSMGLDYIGFSDMVTKFNWDLVNTTLRAINAPIRVGRFVQQGEDILLQFYYVKTLGKVA